MVRARRSPSRRIVEPARGRGDDAAARDRILDAAEELIAEAGYDATPTARIAERAGVAKGLVFYYFPARTTCSRSLFAERLPSHPLCSVGAVAVAGDVSGSLLRLAHRLDLARRNSRVLRAILFREAGNPHRGATTPRSAARRPAGAAPNASSMRRALDSWTVNDGARRQARTSRSCCITPTPTGTTARCPTSPPRPTSSPARSLPDGRSALPVRAHLAPAPRARFPPRPCAVPPTRVRRWGTVSTRHRSCAPGGCGPPRPRGRGRR